MSNVELKHIDLDEKKVRAIARQAEAERLRPAKIIDAEGELQAAEKLVEQAPSWRVVRNRCSCTISARRRTSQEKGAQQLCSPCRST